MVTLNPSDFDAHAGRLAKEVEVSSGTHYDAIVAVRRGGSFVCDAFCRHFPRHRYGKRYDVTLQRPSTKRKQGTIGKLLKKLPYFILDGMRIAESGRLAAGRRMKRKPKIRNVEIPAGLTAALTHTAHPEILLIDDAIDSGDTLFAIVETLKKTNPEANVDIAVFTETTQRPRIRANHTLYRNRTLIRFPWSSDYKNL